MIVVDTNAIISLGFCDLSLTSLENFDVHTIEVVLEELEEIMEYDDKKGKIAERILHNDDKITIHDVREEGSFKHRRIDKGGCSCVILARKIKADFLVTDDIRDLPYLKNISMTKVVFSPIFLKALVHKDVLTEKEAKEKLIKLIENRDWFETPIYERSLELFD